MQLCEKYPVEHVATFSYFAWGAYFFYTYPDAKFKGCFIYNKYASCKQDSQQFGRQTKLCPVMLIVCFLAEWSCVCVRACVRVCERGEDVGGGGEENDRNKGDTTHLFVCDNVTLVRNCQYFSPQ